MAYTRPFGQVPPGATPWGSGNPPGPQQPQHQQQQGQPPQMFNQPPMGAYDTSGGWQGQPQPVQQWGVAPMQQHYVPNPAFMQQQQMQQQQQHPQQPQQMMPNYYPHPAAQPPPPPTHYSHPMQHPSHPPHHPQQGPHPSHYGHPPHQHPSYPGHHPQQGPPPPHPQQQQPPPPPPHPQQQPTGPPSHYPHAPHPYQHPPHPQQQVAPPPPQPQMPPHYVHPQHAPHPQQQPPPPPHWLHGPNPQQQALPPHPHQQHMMPHPPQPAYYQPAYYPPAQHPYPPVPVQQMLQQPQMMPQQPMPAPVASPHHPPSRTHTPQHLPQSQTPTRVSGPPQNSTPASPSIIPKVEKKEIVFPKNSVEATKPTATKKRKITSKDVTDVEVWRLLMCLKSGLLAESSWAIDVLSILLNDDSTLMYFGLKEMPGLLEAILEHFKCCLNELYDGLVSDTILKPVLSEIEPAPMIKQENGVLNDKNLANNNNNPNVTNNNIDKNETTLLKRNKKNVNGVVENNRSADIVIRNDRTVVLKSKNNYTLETRDGKSVHLKNGVTLNENGPAYELIYKPVDENYWQEGYGEDTSHIQVYFDPKNFADLSKRCICLSTILRNLSFVPNNDSEMSDHAGLILVLGRLLVLKHDEVVPNDPESTPKEWHLLNSVREDTFVIIANISSSLNLTPFNDKINLALLDGLLHWACSSSSYALDPFPSMTVSPQRLALESLAKLSIIEGNVDLILATPPWSRIEKLFQVLALLLDVTEDQTIREFSLVILSNLTSADSGIARKVALTGAAIPRLISFLETSLTDSDTFSTTQDMLRRAATTLKSLSQLVDNHSLFAQHQQRLLNLVMSPKLDREVVPIIADVIFEISLSD